MAHDRGIADVLGDLGETLGHLFRTELRLAGAEAEAKVNKAATSLIPVAAGGIVMMAAIVLLLHAAAMFLIEQGLAPSLSYLLLAIVSIVVGYVLVRTGLAQISSISIAPKRAIGQVQEDFAVAKEQVTAS
jgi:hypothetical protein